MRLRIITVAVLLLLAGGAFAQSPTALGGSVVSGRVFCGDTDAPARFATVVLEPVRAVDSYSEKTSRGVSAHLSGIQTLPDGSFTIPHVLPGAYYVFVSAPGYVSPLSALGLSHDELQKPTKEMKQEIAELVPQVRVQAGLSASVNLTLLRGAAVSGTVLYDDGAPAAGLDVTLLTRQKDKWVHAQNGPLEGGGSVTTDDRGDYRFSGLPAGRYLAMVDLRIGQTNYDISPNGYGMSTRDSYSIPVYSGNAMRMKDAAAFDLKLGDEHTGEDIQVPLTKLHSISGSVTAARDGHVINAGTVALLHADDRSEEATTQIAAGDSGWTLNYVPEGDYILRVTGAADDQYEEVANPPGTTPPVTVKSHVLHAYGPVEQALHVGGDLSNVVLSVPEQQAAGTETPQ